MKLLFPEVEVTRSLYNSLGNLVKRGYTNLWQEEKRVINSNELVAKRVEEYVLRKQQMDTENFVSGIMAQSLEIDPEAAETSEEAPTQNNVIKANMDIEGLVTNARKEAEDILAMAKTQAMQIEADARARAEKDRMQMFELARQQGYEEGMEKAAKEAARAEQELRVYKKQLEEEYQSIVDELEPRFVDTITGIYEHIFHVELRSYREVLTYLISTTMRKIEGNRSFMIHVSKDDYPYVSMQKKQIAAGAAASNSSVEIVEDMTLSRNECLIETEGGVFDCGLGTQLTELRQKLKLLSYEK